MLSSYVKIFNIILNSGEIPNEWLLGNIIPIYKRKGAQNDPRNYRPITILSCVGKLFTSLLNNRLTMLSDELNIICENQAGFRKGYSTIDNIFVLNSLIDILKNKKKKLFCAFVDFEKAFDKVWRTAMGHKLLTYNINGKIFKVILNMYDDIKSRILFQGEISEYFSCNNGLRQGENLSPFLFAIYMNDLEKYFLDKNITGLSTIGQELEDKLFIYLKLFILLYADDTVFMAESGADLQNQLDWFCEYCKQWKLKVNIDKTKVMVFSNGRMPKCRFKLESQNIEIVKEFVYLGVVFSRGGSFIKTIKRNVNKGTQAMYDILRKGRIHNLSLSC